MIFLKQDLAFYSDFDPYQPSLYVDIHLEYFQYSHARAHVNIVTELHWKLRENHNDDDFVVFVLSPLVLLSLMQLRAEVATGLRQMNFWRMGICRGCGCVTITADDDYGGCIGYMQYRSIDAIFFHDHVQFLLYVVLILVYGKAMTNCGSRVVCDDRCSQIAGAETIRDDICVVYVVVFHGTFRASSIWNAICVHARFYAQKRMYLYIWRLCQDNNPKYAAMDSPRLPSPQRTPQLSVIPESPADLQRTSDCKFLGTVCSGECIDSPENFMDIHYSALLRRRASIGKLFRA